MKQEKNKISRIGFQKDLILNALVTSWSPIKNALWQLCKN
jgi:hypothetical protein